MLLVESEELTLPVLQCTIDPTIRGSNLVPFLARLEAALTNLLGTKLAVGIGPGATFVRPSTTWPGWSHCRRSTRKPSVSLAILEPQYFLTVSRYMMVS